MNIDKGPGTCKVLLFYWTERQQTVKNKGRISDEILKIA
jgi:hypothetical protein